jgi:magnesium-transporting ATPase (P-type)
MMADGSSSTNSPALSIWVWLPIIIAFVFLSVVLIVLEVTYKHTSINQALALVQRKQFASGENLFLIMILSAVPFFALSGFAFTAIRRSYHLKFLSQYLTALVSVTGALVHLHVSTLLPLYRPHDHVSSTSAIAFFLAPIYGILVLIVGLGLGWLLYTVFLRENDIGDNSTDDANSN